MSSDADDAGAERTAIVKKLERVYNGVFKLDRATVIHSTFDGGEQEIVRECLERGEAAAVLLMDRKARAVWLVEQFRYPAMGVTGGWIEELPAGMVNSDDATPAQAAMREVAEETDFIIDDDALMEHVATFFVSPGGTSERVHLYVVEVDGDARASGQTQYRRDKEEDIRLVQRSLDEFVEDAMLGRIEDGKTLVAGLWLAANRSRLGV